MKLSAWMLGFALLLSACGDDDGDGADGGAPQRDAGTAVSDGADAAIPDGGPTCIEEPTHLDLINAPSEATALEPALPALPNGMLPALPE